MSRSPVFNNFHPQEARAGLLSLRRPCRTMRNVTGTCRRVSSPGEIEIARGTEGMRFRIYTRFYARRWAERRGPASALNFNASRCLSGASRAVFPVSPGTACGIFMIAWGIRVERYTPLSLSPRSARPDVDVIFYGGENNMPSWGPAYCAY